MPRSRFPAEVFSDDLTSSASGMTRYSGVLHSDSLVMRSYTLLMGAFSIPDAVGSAVSGLYQLLGEGVTNNKASKSLLSVLKPVLAPFPGIMSMSEASHDLTPSAAGCSASTTALTMSMTDDHMSCQFLTNFTPAHGDLTSATFAPNQIRNCLVSWTL